MTSSSTATTRRGSVATFEIPCALPKRSVAGAFGLTPTLRIWFGTTFVGHLGPGDDVAQLARRVMEGF